VVSQVKYLTVMSSGESGEYQEVSMSQCESDEVPNSDDESVVILVIRVKYQWVSEEWGEVPRSVEEWIAVVNNDE